MRNKKLLIVYFALILLCSNRCAIEGTSFHLYNNSKYNITLLSKQETKDYKDSFLSKEVIKERTIGKYNEMYIGFKENELDQFKDNQGGYIFYILELKGRLSKDFLIRDSIEIKTNKISFNKSENCITYNGKSIYFLNKN